MGHAVPLAVAGTMIFALATVPSFLIVEVLLPLTSGFPMFALIVGPMLFGCACLMSKPNPKTMLIGYLSALLFASVGQFQNRMLYDPSVCSTPVAAVFAAGYPGPVGCRTGNGSAAARVFRVRSRQSAG